MFVKILTTMLVLIFFDSIYLYSIKNILYNQITLIQKSPMSVDFFAGLIGYIIYAFGLYYFILREKKSLLDAFLLGAVIIGVFETTNRAFFKNWSYNIVVMDTLWGGILFVLTTFVLRKFFAF